ncbi:hypothetical protein [Streptomyces sp. NPDC127112]|uniref:hypothetical protein n=1 Tax=Streptomyces sp. NPDC127112 TaxID=3345364 RepID=UPI003643E36C
MVQHSIRIGELLQQSLFKHSMHLPIGQVGSSDHLQNGHTGGERKQRSAGLEGCFDQGVQHSIGGIVAEMAPQHSECKCVARAAGQPVAIGCTIAARTYLHPILEQLCILFDKVQFSQCVAGDRAEGWQSFLGDILGTEGELYRGLAQNIGLLPRVVHLETQGQWIVAGIFCKIHPPARHGSSLTYRSEE